MKQAVHPGRWLVVVLIVTATVLCGSDDKQLDNTTTRKPAARVVDGGSKTASHRGPGCSFGPSVLADPGQLLTTPRPDLLLRPLGEPRHPQRQDLP